jgi:hypothetical protein
MKAFKYISYLILVLSLSACVSKHKGHYVPIPDASLSAGQIYEIDTKEYREVREFSDYLAQQRIKPIYLVVENETMVQNETGDYKGNLPNTFRIATLSASADFAPMVRVLTGTQTIMKYYNNKKTRDRLFEIEGAITAYSKDNHIISSDIDFGLDFGSGRGESTTDNSFGNTDKVSSITLDIFFKQNGEIYTKRTATIDIKDTNRGYNFGLSVNYSGFGANAYQTKKEGIGKSLRRLLHYTLRGMLKDVIRTKSLISKAAVNKDINLYADVVPKKRVALATTQKRAENRPKEPIYHDISQEEEAFLREISKGKE